MILDYNPNLMVGSRRIEIEEVAEFAPEVKPEGQSNYL
jgi:hypothetical protein